MGYIMALVDSIERGLKSSLRKKDEKEDVEVVGFEIINVHLSGGIVKNYGKINWNFVMNVIKFHAKS